ncbi:MAG: SusC/RagA family TonB-linked outer membrane protein, partial [Muribaculaceae bacterium]|nr:SusC/RagA family TonB-linked outer membrane protein [Muribaculaceae bacterium]
MRAQLTSAASWLAKRFSVLMILICCAVAPAIAQQITVRGTVVDDTDEPLPGVSVVIKGHKTGVMTDIDGNYVINAKPNDVIDFTYIGMKPESVKVNGRTKIDVKMTSDSNMLDEFVAVGYGQQKRGTITGAVSTVKGAELLNVPVMSVSNIVGSRVAGIASKQTSGEPGADSATLTLRGMSGIIYVIDGVKRTSQDFNQLDPNEIEQVSILKDAASVAIYGLDANGVIIVTTKRGVNEKTKISYSGSVGISQNAEYQEWLDGPGYAYWYNKGLEMDGLQPIFTEEHVRKMIEGVDGWGNTNWYKEVFGTGFRTAHNLSATGGNERVKFFAALSYLKEDGNVDKFGFERWNIRSNIDADIVSGLKFSMNISARLQDQDNPYYSANPDAFGNIGSQMVRMLPYLPKTVTYEGNEYYTGNYSNPGCWSVLTSIYDQGYNKVNHNNINTNMALQWDTPFLPGLSLKFNVNYDANFQFTKLLNNPGHFMRYVNQPNQNLAPDVLEYTPAYVNNATAISLTENASRNSTLTTLTTVSYNNSFGNHNISALLLAETRDYKTNNIGGTGTGLTFPSLDVLDKTSDITFAGDKKIPTLGGSRSMARNAGFAARINYNFDERYFLEASVRRDGSYLFGGMNKRWITLPGVSLGWRIDREEFFTADWVNNLKIRGGYGKTATSGVSPFMWRNTMAVGDNGVVIGPSTGPY